MNDLGKERKRTYHHNVMISSTTRDLPDHRKAVLDAVWRMNMFPILMETGTATPGDAIDFSLKLVDEAEVYIGIFGYRYGYVPDDPRNAEKRSITEMEYRRAIENNIPVLIFIMGEDHPGPKRAADYETFYEQDSEKKKKLTALLDEITKQHDVGFFDSPQDLGLKVYQALNELKDWGSITFDPELNRQRQQESLAPAHAKPIPVPPAYFIAHPYILTRKFFGRQIELVALDEWAKSDDTTMIVEAIGGIGKSMLTWEWIQTRAKATIPELAGVMWWSFYESDASTSNYLRYALAYVTGKPIWEFNSVEFEDQTVLLQQELCKKPYLLALDGLERILVAYHRIDAPHLRDEEAGESSPRTEDEGNSGSRDGSIHLRSFTDPRHAMLFRLLTQCWPTKILVSTRLVPSDLQDKHSKKLLPGIRSKHLNGLDPNDALAMMDYLGVHGNPSQLKKFMAQFDNHSLLLGIIAGRINEYRPAPGNFDQWYLAEGRQLNLNDLDIAQRRTQILHYALEGLSPEKRKLLGQIAAFRYPVNYDGLCALNPYLPVRSEAPIRPTEPFKLWRLRWNLDQAKGEAVREQIQAQINEEETQFAREQAEFQQKWEVYQRELVEYEKAAAEAQTPFHGALGELEDRGLLQWDRSTNRYDLHPVVRAYAFEDLANEERFSTYQQIRNYFESLPPENLDEVTETNQLRRSLEIYHALVGSRQLDEAAHFYEERLSEMLEYHIANYNLIVELLTPLFLNGTDQLPALSDPFQQNACVTTLAGAFYYLEQTEKALKLYGLTLKLWLDQKDATNLGVELLNYATALRSNNQLAAAQRACELARELAKAAHDQDGLAWSYLSLLGIYKDTGQWDKIEETYRQFNAALPHSQTTFWQTDAEKYYAESLLYRGQDATAVLEKAWELAVQSRDPVGQRQIHWLRGETALLAGDYSNAAGHFMDAITLCQKHGAPDDLRDANGGLARTRAYQGKYEEALQLVEEGVQDIDAAEVCLLQGKTDRAKEYALKAYKWAWADGPPFVRWWHLERARKVLALLSVTEIMKSPFDPAKVKPVPYEKDIRAFIEELKTKRDSALAEHSQTEKS